MRFDIAGKNLKNFHYLLSGSLYHVFNKLNDVLYIKQYNDNDDLNWEKPVDHNPHLKPWSRPEPNQVAGKGNIEKPDEIENIIHQTRSTPSTEYENQLGEALEEIFGADIDQLPEIVIKLNEMGIQAPYGEACPRGDR